MIPDKVLSFLKSGLRNRWIAIGNLEVYVRISLRNNPRFHRKHKIAPIKCFDIANVVSHDNGVGIFTQFFESLKELKEEGFEAIYIEQVLSERFADFFRKHGCVEINVSSIPSFYYFLD